MTIGFASLSIVYFSFFVTKNFDIGFYCLAPLLVGCLASFISARPLNNKNNKKETNLGKKLEL